MFIDKEALLYVLLALAIVVLALLLKRFSKVRVWIKTAGKVGMPLQEIGYLDMMDDETAAEVHLPGSGGKTAIGRVIVNPQSKINNGYVQSLISDIEDESIKPRYVQCGYICFDSKEEVDKYGYIYKQVKGKRKKEIIGYCARPSAPNVPTLKGERTWRTLWFVKTLCAYEGIPEQETSEKTLQGKAKQSAQSFHKLMNINADQNGETILHPSEGASPIANEAEKTMPVQDASAEPVAQQPEKSGTEQSAESTEELQEKSPVQPEPPKQGDDAHTSDQEEKNIVEQKESEAKDGKQKNQKKQKKQKAPTKQPATIVNTYGFNFFSNNYLTPEARACAYGMLCRFSQKKKYSEYYKEKPYGWADTAMLSTLIYTLIFLVVYTVNTGFLKMPLIGDDFLALLIMVGFYFLLWTIVRLVKIDCIENSNSFQSKLDMLNKNLSLGVANWSILFLSLLALYFTYEYLDYDLIPLIVCILIGTSVNMTLKPANRKWRICSSYKENDDSWDEEDEDEVINPAGDISRTYEWDLDQKYSSMQLHGSLTLYFSSREISDLRKSNPFFAQRKDRTDKEYILEMFNEQVAHKKAYLSRVRYIAWYINKLITDHSLTPLDKIQFTLDFIQEPNVDFVSNKDCKTINYYDDYIRYPDETLYDKEGDCNSKSLLAAMLFHVMGYDVIYLASRKYQHAAIGIEVSPKDLAEGWYGNMSPEAIIQENGSSYIYCETTGDRFSIGSTMVGMTVDDFDEKVVLSKFDESSESEDDFDENEIISRMYNWDLDSEKGNKLHGSLTLEFTESQMEELREANPFRTYGKDSNTYEKNITDMFNYLRQEPTRMKNVDAIADYIKGVFATVQYSELEKVQFALDFAQAPNINYCVDENCSSIGFAKEYMRYPDEVLFDKEGDCDCKSSLAAAILHQMGYNVLIMLSQKLAHAAIAVECKEEWLAEINLADFSNVIREHNGRRYIFCETTADGYKVGHIKENDSIHDFETIVEILV